MWNRLRYVKNPDTGKCVSRVNLETEWMRKEVPDLRIISDEVWAAAKDRQGHGRRAIKAAGNPGGARRPQYLYRPHEVRRLRGRIHHDRQASARLLRRARPGRCDNHLTIRRDEFEARVLQALQEKLRNQELFAEFCEEFTGE